MIFTAKIALLVAFAFGNVALADEYDTFWTEDTCSQRSGSVDYSIENDGIFQNGGPYYTCSGDEHILVSYPPGDSAGTTPNHCYVWTVELCSEARIDMRCHHLDDFGFTTGDGGYYRLSTNKTCPTIS